MRKETIMNIDNTIHWFCKMLKIIIVILFVLLILNVWFAILDRYMLKLQIVWTESLARYLMMWTMFLSVPIIIARRENISLTFLQMILSEKRRAYLLVFVNTISTAFYAFVAFYGFSFAATGAKSISAFFDFPMTYAYYSIPVSFTLMAIVSTLITIKDFQKIAVTK